MCSWAGNLERERTSSSFSTYPWFPTLTEMPSRNISGVVSCPPSSLGILVPCWADLLSTQIKVIGQHGMRFRFPGRSGLKSLVSTGCVILCESWILPALSQFSYPYTGGNILSLREYVQELHGNIRYLVQCLAHGICLISYSYSLVPDLLLCHKG